MARILAVGDDQFKDVTRRLDLLLQRHGPVPLGAMERTSDGIWSLTQFLRVQHGPEA